MRIIDFWHQPYNRLFKDRPRLKIDIENLSLRSTILSKAGGDVYLCVLWASVRVTNRMLEFAGDEIVPF